VAHSANQTYGTWHNDTQHNDIYHKDTVGSVAMLSVSYAKDGQFIYAECREVHSTIVGKKYSLSLYSYAGDVRLVKWVLK
jgi:hypothetical protein